MVAKKNEARSSNKRPRASIACYRCHHKKVRCDATQPECTRCKSTGVVCAYPPSRRSRSTQPTNISPFINDITQLETRIREIESDLEKQRSMVKAFLLSEKDNVSSNNTQLMTNNSPNKKDSNKKKNTKMHENNISPESTIAAAVSVQDQPCVIYDTTNMIPDWNTFQQDQMMTLKDPMLLGGNISLDSSPTPTRSSSLGSQSDFDFTLQPSYSNTSTNSSYSTAFADSYNQMFDYPMLIQTGQDNNLLPNNQWYYS